MPLVLVTERPRTFTFVADGSDAALALANHEAAGNPHTVYATDTDLTNHAGGSDPHTVYQLESEKNQLNGYAGLDGGGQMPAGTLRLATAGSRGAIQLAGDLGGTGAAPTVPGLSGIAGKENSGVAAGLVTAHEALSDPHPGYLTPAEGNAAYGARDVPVCTAIQTTVQSIGNAAFVALLFQSEDEDSHAMHDNSTNPSRLTVPVGWDGVWGVSGSVMFATNGTGGRLATLRKNGTGLLGVCTGAAAGATVQAGATTGTRLLRLVAGDYIECMGFQSSGGALNTVPNTEQAPNLSMWWVRP